MLFAFTRRIKLKTAHVINLRQLLCGKCSSFQCFAQEVGVFTRSITDLLRPPTAQSCGLSTQQRTDLWTPEMGHKQNTPTNRARPPLQPITIDQYYTHSTIFYMYSLVWQRPYSTVLPPVGEMSMRHSIFVIN